MDTEPRKRRKRSYPKKHRDFLNSNRHLYDRILKKQKGTCALCSRTPSENRKLSLDHRHTEPMKIRGLLCYRCNTGLKEWMDKEWLLKAAKYVENDIK